MTDEEERAIVYMQKDLEKAKSLHLDIVNTDRFSVKILLNLVQKQEKIIDKMIEYINNIQDCPLENCGTDLDCENRCNNDEETLKQCWKRYFKEVIENE